MTAHSFSPEWSEAAPGSGVSVRDYHCGAAVANALIVALGDGRAVVVSPNVDPTEPDFARAESAGEVVALVAPNAMHNLGIRAWRERFPAARLLAPDLGLNRLNGLGLGSFEPVRSLDLPPGLRAVELEGARLGSLILRSDRGARPVVYVDELMGNQQAPSPSRMFRTLFWLTGSAPGLVPNYFYSRLFLKDRHGAAQAILAELGGDPVVLCAHGAPIRTADELATTRTLLQAL